MKSRLDRIFATPCPSCRAQANETCDADAAVVRTFVVDEKGGDGIWVCRERVDTFAYWPTFVILDDLPPSETPETKRRLKAQAEFLEKLTRNTTVHVTPRSPDLISRLMADLAIQEAKAPWAGKAFLSLHPSTKPEPEEKP